NPKASPLALADTVGTQPPTATVRTACLPSTPSMAVWAGRTRRHIVAALATVAVQGGACQQHQRDRGGDGYADGDEHLVQHRTRLQRGEGDHRGDQHAAEPQRRAQRWSMDPFVETSE